MIISPPLLREHSDGESDADWIEKMMVSDRPVDYPLNRGRSWHGGIHLTGCGTDSVRCVADGKVLSVRQPDVAKNDSRPLNYRGATDNGYILLKHETEIGSGDEGKIVYYSLYMHLSAIDENAQPGNTLYRKDKLGTAGKVDGNNALHFQIFCDDDNIQKIAGRKTPEIDLTRNGRTDVVYGDMHFYLPAGTMLYGSRPENNSVFNPHPIMTTAVPLFVTMSFDKGSCTMLTRQENPNLPGSYISVGAALTDTDGEDYEYNLYATALKLYPQSPSAGYELLRFGRIVNTDYETLVPADAPLWRSINTPAGAGMVNLADSNVKVYSDADFPHWTGWKLVDDDTDKNSQCNSPTILCSLQQNLSRTICHFPLEWDESTVEARFQWLKSPNDVLPKPMQECDLKLLTDHGKALCLEENPIPAGRVWHFDPRQFIGHFRKCGWLSKPELKQLIPLHALNGARWDNVIYVDAEGSTAARICNGLNKVMLKYLITTPLRMTSFLSNAIQESAWLSTTKEAYRYTERDRHTRQIIRTYNIWYYPWYGRGLLQLTNPENYFNYFKYRGCNFPLTLKDSLSSEYERLYRNRDLRYSDNHLSDAEYSDLSSDIVEWRNKVEESDYEPADSAGFYWCSTKMPKYADAEHVLERCVIRTNEGAKIYYRSMAFWNASAAVNLPARINIPGYSGLNGFDARCCVYGSAIYVLTELLFPNERQEMVLENPESNQLRREV